MYVLYFEEHDYDGGNFYIIATSKDKEKLYTRRQWLIEEYKEWQKDVGLYQKKSDEITKELKNMVSDWIDANQEGINFKSVTKDQILCNYNYFRRGSKDFWDYKHKMNKWFYLDKLKEPPPLFDVEYPKYPDGKGAPADMLFINEVDEL